MQRCNSVCGNAAFTVSFIPLIPSAQIASDIDKTKRIMRRTHKMKAHKYWSLGALACMADVSTQAARN